MINIPQLSIPAAVLSYPYPMKAPVLGSADPRRKGFVPSFHRA